MQVLQYTKLYGATSDVQYLQCVEIAQFTGAEHNSGPGSKWADPKGLMCGNLHLTATNNIRNCGAMIPIHQTSCGALAQLNIRKVTSYSH